VTQKAAGRTLLEEHHCKSGSDTTFFFFFGGLEFILAKQALFHFEPRLQFILL
jgi:hypothetical protein